jgi:hypothetical protein
MNVTQINDRKNLLIIGLQTTDGRNTRIRVISLVLHGTDRYTEVKLGVWELVLLPFDAWNTPPVLQ